MLRPFRPVDFDAADTFGREGMDGRMVPALPASDGAGVVELLEEWRTAGDLLHLVIADPSTDVYLGEATLVLGEPGVGEVGCGIIEAARGRGIATRALRLLTEWSFAALDLGRVQLFVVHANDAGLRLAEKAGFQREGLLRAYAEDNGERLDTVIFSLLPSDVASDS